MCGFSANVEAGRAPRSRSVRDAGTTRRDERTNVLASIWYSTGHIVVCNKMKLGGEALHVNTVKLGLGV